MARTAAPVIEGTTSKRVYAGRALGFLTIDSSVRRAAIRAVEWPNFDRIVLVLILVNCVFMAVRDPLAEEPPAHMTIAEWIFTVAFTLESAALAPITWSKWDWEVALVSQVPVLGVER